MSSDQDSSSKFEKLRQQAEELIQKQPELSTTPPPDILELIHELKIHQAELQIQNEELQRAQTELYEIHREFENLYEFAPCGYLTLDAKGIITRANLTAVRLLGTNRQFLTGSGLSQYVAQDWHHIYTAARNECIETSEKQSIEIPLKNKSELPLWVRADIEADHDESGAVILWRIVLMDISARHQAEKEKKDLEYQLSQSQKMESIGNLAGGIAHDFNNLLSIIIGNNELIREELPEWSLLKDSCEEIRLAGLRARDIVKHLLTFSRQDNLTQKPIDVSAVVMESLKLIRATTPANIEIRHDISPGCRPIFGDSTQINQILLNLCNNASAALPIAGGRIDIELCNLDIDKVTVSSSSTLLPGKYVRLRVRDNGSGIDKEIVDRIFEPYFTTKDVDEGSGIGLSVVHGIVENHGGSIVCESAKGRGTTFTILLPAYEGQVEEEPDRKIGVPGRGECILYIDDEPSIAKLGKRYLHALGYKSVSVTDPAEALELIKSESDRFDLVISDMAMPKMPGDQLISEILAIKPDMPTIICTGYSSRMSEKEASEIGVKAFLMKPLDKTELSKTVRKVLDEANG